MNHSLKTALLVTVTALACIARNAAAEQVAEPTELVDHQHCMFCHTPDTPFLAPSFHQIAERYRDTPNAHLMLEDKLRRGGRAHWGDTPMPSAAERGGPLSAEDAKRLINWVMSQ